MKAQSKFTQKAREQNAEGLADWGSHSSPMELDGRSHYCSLYHSVPPLPTSCTAASCPQLTHIDARLDGGFRSCAFNSDFWFAA